MLCAKFEGLSISSSAVRNHMVNHCKLSLKNTKQYNLERDSDRTIKLRFDYITTWRADGVNYMENCVFIDEAGFNTHQTRIRGWSKVGEPAIAKVPKHKGTNISIIGCISSWGIVNFCKVDPLKPSDAEKIEREFPIPDSKRKRKVKDDDKQQQRKLNKGTTAYHVVKFIEQTMDILDKQGKNGVYIVMDNCRIHHSDFVTECIKKRGYRALFMPPYSPFLNPIEECWSKVKSYTKRHPLSETDQLTPRIATACKTITVDDCQGWIRHSERFWDRCLAKEQLIF